MVYFATPSFKIFNWQGIHLYSTDSINYFFFQKNQQTWYYVCILLFLGGRLFTIWKKAL